MWTKKENKDLLPNITVFEVYNDNELKQYQLFPNEGYVIVCPSLDTEEVLEDGTIELHRYVSDGGITVSKDYDFSSSEFMAIKNEEEKV